MKGTRRIEEVTFETALNQSSALGALERYKGLRW
jgi:hypothetical protein